MPNWRNPVRRDDVVLAVRAIVANSHTASEPASERHYTTREKRLCWKAPTSRLLAPPTLSARNGGNVNFGTLKPEFRLRVTIGLFKRCQLAAI